MVLLLLLYTNNNNDYHLVSTWALGYFPSAVFTGNPGKPTTTAPILQMQKGRPWPILRELQSGEPPSAQACLTPKARLDGPLSSMSLLGARGPGPGPRSMGGLRITGIRSALCALGPWG